MVFSVGGGDAKRNVSVNIVHALDEAKTRGVRILGVVGRDGGHTKMIGDAVVLVPAVDETPHSEAFQAVVWHALSVLHPELMRQENKWESLGAS